MTRSQRKFAGALLLPLSVILWAVLASWIYLAWLMGTPWWVHLPYFALAGLGWVFPAMLILRWMLRPDPGS